MNQTPGFHLVPNRFPSRTPPNPVYPLARVASIIPARILYYQCVRNNNTKKMFLGERAGGTINLILLLEINSEQTQKKDISHSNSADILTRTDQTKWDLQPATAYSGT